MNQQPMRRQMTPKEREMRRVKARAGRRRAQMQAITFIILLLLLVILCVSIAVVVISRRNRPPIVTDPETTEQSTETEPESVGKETDPASTQTTPVTGESGESEPSESETEDAYLAFPLPDVEFTADLSEYEQYMNPSGEARDAYLVLVNPDHALTANDNPSDLVDVSATRKDGRNTQQMRRDAAMALEAMFLEADALGHLNNSTGYELSVTSAYRSYSYQEYLFNNYVEEELSGNPGMTREEAEAKVVTYSCRAGTSEHQTGLCADLHNQASASSSHPERFANTPEGKWVHENAWKFGFVLRFPEDKVEVTGIKYESWHFRYVGRYHAYQMTQLDMCLEEYTEYLAEQE